MELRSRASFDFADLYSGNPRQTVVSGTAADQVRRQESIEGIFLTG
jgi:hypothetical protein